MRRGLLICLGRAHQRGAVVQNLPPPLPEQARPTLSGYQNAVVTGPVDSEIHCDEYGRVKVQFAWDRVGEHNEHSSCWLRVASGLAHEHYGSVPVRPMPGGAR